jgi:hypothetical protein
MVLDIMTSFRKPKDEGLMGKVDFEQRIIFVDPDQDHLEYKKTLLHEIIHIGFDCFGLNNDGNMPVITNEYITTVTTNMIQQGWFSNRHFIPVCLLIP